MTRSIVGGVVCVVGAFFTIAGIAAWFGISIAFEKAVHNAVTVTSTTDPGYRLWSDNSDPVDGRPAKFSIRFYNITNVAAVRAGTEAPVLAITQPYTYTKIVKRLGAVFSADGTAVSYVPHVSYIWKDEDNVGVSRTDKVNTYSVTYLGTLGQVAGYLAAEGLPMPPAESTFAMYLAAGTFLSTLKRYTGDPIAFFLDPTLAVPAAFLFTLGSLPGSPPSSIGPTQVGDLLGNPTTGWVPSAATAALCVGRPGLCAKPVVRFLDLALKVKLACAPGVMPCAPLSAIYALNPSFALLGDAGAYAAVMAMFWFLMGHPSASQAALGYASFTGSGAVGLAHIGTHSVDDTAFGFTWSPGGVPTFFPGLFNNDTNEAVTLANNKREAILTGKNDESKAYQFTMVNNVTKVTSYSTPLDVVGSSGTRNKMKLRATQPLTVFVSQIMRPLNLTAPAALVKVKGIPTLNFTPSAAALAKKPEYDMPGDALFNISSLARGLPTWLSLPRFFGADRSLGAAWGLPAPEQAVDGVSVMAEPFSGVTLKANLRLQVNYNVPGPAFNWFTKPTTWPNVTNPGTNGGSLIPILSADEHGEITDADAEKLRKTFKKLAVASAAITGALVGIGALLLLLGGLVCAKSLKSKSAATLTPHTELQDKNAPQSRPGF